MLDAGRGGPDRVRERAGEVGPRQPARAEDQRAHGLRGRRRRRVGRLRRGHVRQRLLGRRAEQAEVKRDLGRGRLPLEPLVEVVRGAGGPPEQHHLVAGQSDRPRVVGQGARDGLADPPGRVGREAEAAPVVVLLDRAYSPRLPSWTRSSSATPRPV